MICPKCNSGSLSVSQLTDYPCLVATCMCGFYQMSMENKPDKEPEKPLPFCVACKANRVMNRKSIYCCKACYYSKMKQTPSFSNSREASRKKGRLARKRGDKEWDCPYTGYSLPSVRHKKAWLEGYRE